MFGSSKFAGKCKGKKIVRKNRRKEKAKKCKGKKIVRKNRRKEKAKENKK